MTGRSSRHGIALFAAEIPALALLFFVSCGDFRQNQPEPAAPRPTRTVEIPSAGTAIYGGSGAAEGPEVPDTGKGPDTASTPEGPEVTATADTDLALVFEEPDPANARWVLLYTPPFLSAQSATLLPEGDGRDPRPRSVFTFSVIKSGRDEVEFGRISLTGTALPNVAARVTVAAG